MDVYDARRINVRLFAQELGSISALADYLGKKQSQISALIGSVPTKNIGSRLAREIERAFDKPPGALDNLQTDKHGRPILTDAQAELYQVISEWTDAELKALTRFLKDIMASRQPKSRPQTRHARASERTTTTKKTIVRKKIK